MKQKGKPQRAAGTKSNGRLWEAYCPNCYTSLSEQEQASLEHGRAIVCKGCSRKLAEDSNQPGIIVAGARDQTALRHAHCDTGRSISI